jgi:ribosomal protein L6P/L9E
MGFLIPYKKSVLKGQPKILTDVKEVFILKNEKFVENQIENINKQFKNIIKGITQGFSINLELKGIGYSAQLQSQKEIKSEASLHNNQPSLQNINESTPLAIKISASGGQIETNISKIKKYILSKDKPCKITNQNFLEKILLTFKPKQTNITYNLIDKKYLERQGYRIYDDFSKLSFQSFQQEQILRPACSNVIDNSKKEQTNVLPKTSRANKIIMSNFVKDVQNDLARNLTLRLGTSHNIIFPLYKYEICVKILTQQNNFVTLVLFGISHEIIKHVAAEIFLLKKPEPYKGKGIRYDGEKFFAKEKTKKN